MPDPVLDTNVPDPNASAAYTPPEGKWYSDYKDVTQEQVAVYDKFESHEAMSKGYIDLESMKGRALFMPKEDASDTEKAEKMSEIHSKLGRPDKADDYEIGDLPEGITEENLDTEFIGGMKALLFKSGVPKENCTELAQAVLKHDAAIFTKVKEQDAVKTEANATALTKLQADCKNDDGYKTYVNLARQAAAMVGGDELGQYIHTTALDGVRAGDHVPFLRICHALGEAYISSGKIVPSENTNKAELTAKDQLSAMYPRSPELQARSR